MVVSDYELWDIGPAGGDHLFRIDSARRLSTDWNYLRGSTSITIGGYCCGKFRGLLHPWVQTKQRNGLWLAEYH